MTLPKIAARPYKKHGKLHCIRCDRPAALPPRNIYGFQIPQMCNNCLIERAGEVELARKANNAEARARARARLVTS
jgi:hypothetical protein